MTSLSREQRDRLVAKLEDKLVDVPATPARPSYGPVHQSAALVSSFSVAAFENQGASAEEISAVLADSRPVRQDDETLRWVLKPGVRAAVVTQIATDSNLKAVLDDAPEVPDDPVQEMMTAYVQGSAPDLDEQSPEQLAASFRALQWLGDNIQGAPSKTDAEQRLEYIAFVQPFHDLAGENFQGRKRELNRLSDYVGVRSTSSITEISSRVIRYVTNFKEKPPLMLFGPGGMGKSALLAKFIIDHTNLGNRQFPFIFADFDRPLITAREPLILLYEGLRQLSIQYPEARESILSLRESWEDRFTHAVGATTRGSSEVTDETWQPGNPLPAVAGELRADLLDEFVKMLAVLDIEDRPLLMVLDTFEKVQARSRAEIETLWRFLETLQGSHPQLRVVLSGRVEFGAMVDDTAEARRQAKEEYITEPLPLKGLDRKDAERYLAGAGLPGKAAKMVASHVVHPKDGASPLTLRVAAAVWARQQARAEDSDEPDSEFWSDLEAGRVQYQLIGRYLGDIDDRLIARLAVPAFVMRRLTAEIVMEVLAPAYDIDVPDLEHARVLVDRLRSEVSLLASVYWAEGELEPRPEVRRHVLELMKDIDGEMLDGVHERAAAYYQHIADERGLDDQEGLAALEEEIYHRLAMGQPDDLIRSRWDSQLVTTLDDASEEFDVSERALLEELSGRTVSGAMRQEASLRNWERTAARRASELFELGEYERALSVVGERDERSGGSELYVVESQALISLGRWEEALAIALEGIASFEPGGNTAQLIDLLVTAAQANLFIGAPDDGLALLDRAARLASERDDGVRSLRVEVLRLQFDDEEDGAVAEGGTIASLLDSIRDDELQRYLPLVAAAGAAVGSDYPEVTIRTVRLGALEGLSDTENRLLARALGRFDEEASERVGEPPGMVARNMRLPREDTATASWLSLLRDLPTLVADLIPRALSEYDVQPGDPVLAAIAQILQGDEAEAAPPVEPTTTPAADVVLSNQQRQRLAAALGEAFTADDLAELLFGLGITFETITLRERSLIEVVVEVIASVEGLGRLGEFIIAARAARPQNTEFFAVASELELTTVSLTTEGPGTVDPDQFQDPRRFRERLGTVESQVCLVEPVGEVAGTGFLVAPDLLLTSYEVVQGLVDGKQSPADVRLLFNDPGPTEVGMHRPAVFGLSSDDWLIDASPGPPEAASPGPPEALGHALLRVAGYPGDEPIGGRGSGRTSARRSFVPYDHDSMMPRVGVFVVHYDSAEQRLKLSLGERSAEDMPATESSIEVKFGLAAGASGAPVFDLDLNLVGVVHGKAEANTLLVTPMSAIVEHLERTGLGDLLGRELS